MSSKVKKFKPKTRKNIKSRMKISNGGDPTKGVIEIKRINHAHRLINKTGIRKLKSSKTTTLGRTQKKYLKALS